MADQALGSQHRILDLGPVRPERLAPTRGLDLAHLRNGDPYGRLTVERTGRS